MAFHVDEKIWELFPGMRLTVAAGEGLDNETPRPALAAELQEVTAELRRTWGYENPQSHPRVAAWREAFRRNGVSGKNFPSSIEALSRRALSGKEISSISPLVDLYNVVSLRFVAPAGAWDLDDLTAGLRLGLTAGGEPFTELGSTVTVKTDPGEVSYLAEGGDRELITRQFVWRQSERGKIRPATRRFFFVSEILPELGEDTAEEVRQAFVTAVRSHFGIEPRSAVLVAGDRRWDF